MGRRFEEATGGLTQRRVDYLIRRHLGFSRSEWRELSWIDQRVYLEGLRWEFYEDEEEPETEDLTENWDALSKYGIKVQNV